MTDRELLELAAKAAGITLKWHEPEDGEPWCFIPDCHPPHNRRERDQYSGVIWSPLTDDGDALRLAVTLALDIEFQKPCGVAALRRNYVDGTVTSGYVSNIDADPYAATRRAIVRAAAAIGETK